MRAKNYKGRCTKKRLRKCSDVAKLYDKLQIAFADELENDDTVRSFQVNVPLDGEECEGFTTDFVCENQDGDRLIRECVFRKCLTLPRTIRLMQLSQTYWTRHGVDDWGIVVDKEVEELASE